MTHQPIRVSIKDWGLFGSNKHPDFDLIRYGCHDGSSIVRETIVRRRSDGVVFIAVTGAEFQDNTDWDSDSLLTHLFPAVERIVYDMPRHS